MSKSLSPKVRSHPKSNGKPRRAAKYPASSMRGDVQVDADLWAKVARSDRINVHLNKIEGEVQHARYLLREIEKEVQKARCLLYTFLTGAES